MTSRTPFHAPLRRARRGTATKWWVPNAAHNATNAQQQSYVTAQAATTIGVATLYSIDTATTGVDTKQILGA